MEQRNTSGSSCTAVKGLDWVVVYLDGSLGSPRKKDIFAETYEETEIGSGLWRKKNITRLVQIPQGISILLKTLEGDREASHPDYVAMGAKDEVYSNKSDWVDDNLEFTN